jgi:hypothetical protein
MKVGYLPQADVESRVLNVVVSRHDGGARRRNLERSGAASCRENSHGNVGGAQVAFSLIEAVGVLSAVSSTVVVTVLNRVKETGGIIWEDSCEDYVVSEEV